MAGTPTDDLLERLKDPEYAKLYGEEDAKVDFAITLTKARRSLNLTQRNLADKLGISQPYVAKLEGGEANPTLGTIGRLLATINLRLVTQTAPLSPEPVSLAIQSMEAADVGEYVYAAAYIPLAAAESINDWRPARQEVDYASKVAVAGGTMQ